MITVDYVSDWVSRLNSRLYSRRKSDPSLQNLAGALGAQTQALEDSAQALFSLPSIADSVGAQLDLIGRIVNQPRGGLDDATYRIYLAARVFAHRSSGAPDQIYGVVLAILGLTGSGLLQLTYGSPATFDLLVKPPVSQITAKAMANFVFDAKAAGVRGLVEYQLTDDPNAFTCAESTSLASNTNAGASILPGLPNLFAFPSSGQLLIDNGLATQETVTFVGYDTVTGHFALSGTSGQNHLAGSSMELVGDPGLGFADYTNLSAPAGLLSAVVDVSVPQPPPPKMWTLQTSNTSYDLLAVYGFSPANVFAVGKNGTIIHWNGGSWTVQNSGTTDDFVGVFGASPNVVWAWTATHYYKTTNGGTTWTAYPTPSPGVHINAMWGSSDLDFWASLTATKLFHTTDGGTTWTLISNNSVGGGGAQTGQYLFGVGASSIYLATSGNVAHWNGTVWSDIGGTPTQNYGALGGTADNNLWLGGQTGIGNADLRYSTTGFTSNSQIVCTTDIGNITAISAAGSVVFASAQPKINSNFKVLSLTNSSEVLSLDQPISARQSRGVWVDQTGIAIAVGDGGTVFMYA